MSEPLYYDNKTSTERKANGARRIWVEGEILNRAEFPVGTPLATTFDVDSGEIIITPTDKSRNHVAGKTMDSQGGWVKPVIDIFNMAVGSVVKDATKFTVSIYVGKIVFKIHHEEVARQEREESFSQNVAANSVSFDSIVVDECSLPNVKSDVVNVAVPVKFDNELFGPVLFNAMESIKASNPGVIVSRKLPSPKTSASALLFAKELERIGYVTGYREEAMMFVAYSRNLAPEEVERQLSKAFGDTCYQTDQYQKKHNDVERLKAERLSLFKSNVEQGFISKGMLFTGGGVSALGCHQAFEEHNLLCKMSFISEFESKYVDVALRQNRVFKESDLKVFIGKIEEVDTGLIEPFNNLGFSQPCVGQCNQGKTKNKIKRSEEHDEAATSVFGTVNVIRAGNPSSMVSENVVGARTSITYQLLREEFKFRGMAVFERILDSSQSGSVENRRRYWMSVVCEDLLVDEAYNMEVPRYQRTYDCVNDLLDTSVAEEDWFTTEKYEKRQAKNLAEGRNFKMNLNDGSERHVGVMSRHYAKRQVSTPHLQREDGLIRLYTGLESARMRSMPELDARRLTRGLGLTLVHQVLGQSVDVNQAKGMYAFTLMLMGLIDSNLPASNDEKPLQLFEEVEHTQMALFG